MTNKPDTITIDRPTLETMRAIAIGNKSLASKCAAQAATIARQGEIIRQLTEQSAKQDRAMKLARLTSADDKAQIAHLNARCFEYVNRVEALETKIWNAGRVWMWPLSSEVE